MTLIATPISHLFDNISIGKMISEVSDCLEVRERSLYKKWDREWLFHFDIDIIHPWDLKIQSYLKKALSHKKDMKLITFQASRCCQGEVIENGIFQPHGKIFSEKEMLYNAQQNIYWLRSEFNHIFDIGLENNNYYPTDAYNIVTETEFICELVRGNNIYFLFDIAHAMVTAHNKNIEYLSYSSKLPNEKTIQLHICEPFLPVGKIGMDAHNEMTSNMLLEVKRLIEFCPNINYLTIEYYKNSNKLMKNIGELRKILNNKCYK